MITSKNTTITIDFNEEERNAFAKVSEILSNIIDLADEEELSEFSTSGWSNFEIDQIDAVTVLLEELISEESSAILK